MFFVYLLESLVDRSIYIGQTNNLAERLKRHNSGRIISTRNKKPHKLVYFEEFETRSKAMFREWEIKKKYNTERKRKLINSFDQSNIEKILGL